MPLVVMIGDSGVGKTYLLHRFSKNKLPEEDVPTIGIEFGTKFVTLPSGQQVKAQIWDTAG